MYQSLYYNDNQKNIKVNTFLNVDFNAPLPSEQTP